MISLRLLGRPSGPADLPLLRSASRLCRSGSSVWVAVAEERRAALQRDLAFAGLGVREEEPPLAQPEHVAAIGTALAPVADASLDVLTLRGLPLSVATSRVLGRRIVRVAPSVRRRRHEACRALLRATDEHASWERRAWVPSASLRRREVRATLRPIVFDRAALTGPRPGGIVRARDGAITRWAFE